MKLAADRAVLLAALGLAARVVERRSTIPILQHVRLVAEGGRDGRLSITASDLDTEIAVDVAVAVGQAGTAALPGHMLRDIVAKLPDGARVEIAVAAASGAATISSGRALFRLQGLDPADFPAVAPWSPAARFALPGGALAALLAPVRFAISSEETRYYLNGVHLHVEDGSAGAALVAVATDGHRLSLARRPLPDGAAALPGVIVPRKAVDEIIRLAEAAGDGMVEVAVSDARLSVADAARGTALATKLIDGTFPEYRRVIPAANDIVVEIDRALLAAVIDRVAAVSAARHRALRLAFSGQGLEISMVDRDTAGEASETLDVAVEAAVEVGFNAAYLADCLAAVATAKVRLSLRDAGSPALIEPVDTRADAPGQLVVLMPMRT